MSRLSGLAVVGYGLTAIGFLQVAVTIAPHIADSVPAAGGAAPAIGVAVALAVDACWATLMHTTMATYKTGQRHAAYGFGAATGAAVLASTILLAAVGHMGPWSAVPVLAALLLVADGVRDQVTVSPETAAEIRARNIAIRDARALAVIEARSDAHAETINGYRESARLAARTAALAGIRVTVQRAEHRATRRIETSTRRYGNNGGAEEAKALGNEARNESSVRPSAIVTDTPAVAPATPTLHVAPDPAPATSDRDALILELADGEERLTVTEISERVGVHKSTVSRRLRQLREARQA